MQRDGLTGSLAFDTLRRPDQGLLGGVVGYRLTIPKGFSYGVAAIEDAMKRHRRAWMFVCLVLAAGPACTPIQPVGKSPLAQPQMSPQAAVLDIYFIRVPFGDPKANDLLWQEIDEQPFPTELRQEMSRNGFRLGVISGQIPTALADLMQLSAEPPPTPQSALESRLNTADLSGEAKVVQRHLQVRPGQRNEIVTSPLHDELPVLLWESNQLCGQTYRQAQSALTVRTQNQRDGRVQLHLVPEIQHGEPKQRWVGGQGVLRLEAGRAKKVFEHLSIAATLAPGQMLVMTNLPARSGSLGHHFFTDRQTGDTVQKLLVIRLSQTQHDDLIAPPEVLQLDEPAAKAPAKPSDAKPAPHEIPDADKVFGDERKAEKPSSPAGMTKAQTSTTNRESR